MVKLATLTNVFFRNSFATSKKSGKQTAGVISYICVSLLFGVLTTLGTYLFYKFAGNSYPKQTILIICFSAMSLITIMFSFFQMNVTLFKSRDYDSLASMPLRNNTIVLSKLAALYLTNLIIDVCSLVPPLIIYLCWGGNIVGFLIGLVGVLFTSIIPILFVTLVAAIVALITAKSKYGDVVTIILYIVFFIGFVVLAAMLPLLNNSDFLNNISSVLPYYVFLNQAFNGEYLGVLWFILINLGAALVTVIFVGLLYTPLNQIKARNAVKTYKSSGNSKSLSTNKILFKKEIDLVTHNPLFLLSSYTSPILVLIIGLISFGVIGKGFFNHNAESVASAISSIRGVNLLLALLIASVSTTTYAAFSMEGKNFPLLFAYPISKRKIIQAKTKAGLIPLVILFTLCSLIQLVVIGIFQGFENITYAMWIYSILLPVLATSVTTLVGTYCGLRYIRLDYTDQNEVLKKSKAMYMTMLYSAIINIVAFVGFSLLRGLLSNNNNPLMDLAVTGIVVGFYAIVITLISIYLNKRGETLFNKAIEK